MCHIYHVVVVSISNSLSLAPAARTASWSGARGALSSSVYGSNAVYLTPHMGLQQYMDGLIDVATFNGKAVDSVFES